MIAAPDELPAGALEQSSPGGLLRLRCDVSYDGTDFHGWARQPGLRTVQQELESALRSVLRIAVETPVRVAVAGRTDAGVHATGQVCHCDVPRSVFPLADGSPPSRNSWATRGSQPDLPASSWEGGWDFGVGARAGVPAEGGQSGADEKVSRLRAADRRAGWEGEPRAEELARVLRRLNGVLPADVRVLRVCVAPPGFDARWSAAWREYSYRLVDDPRDVDPRQRHYVVPSRPLDVPAMATATRPFMGEHDFSAFCRARAGASSVRTILALDWTRQTPVADGRGIVLMRIRADAFCHSMVRALVGAFVAVGEGRWPVDRPGVLLAAGARVPAIPTAAAQGLTLERVGYPPDSMLAEHALRARRWRGG